MVARATIIDEGRRGASRVDPRSGVREHVEFFGPDRLKMFGCTHLPAGEPVGGVVVCSSIQAELLKNYRREVLLGRRLSELGFAVQRFHYRGSGNSDGGTEDMTYESMRDDAWAAADFLRERASVGNLAFVGTRWGALVAASVAAGSVQAPLALWEPAVDASRYFREVFRSRLIRDLKEGGEGSAAPNLVEQLNDEGSLDVLGYSIDKPLYETSMGHTLPDVIGDAARPVLLMQIGRTKALRAEYRKLLAGWQGAGWDVTTGVLEEELAWWFAGEHWQPEERRPVATALIGTTSDWIARHVGAKEAS